MVAAATSRGHEVWIVDGKGDSFDGFPRWPGVHRFEVDPDNHEGMIRALEDFHALRQARSKQKAAGNTPPGGFKHIILVADEVGLLIEGDKQQTERAQDVLRNLVRGVRSVNMHVIIGVHQPSGELLGGTETRRLFGVHIGLALRDRDRQLRTMLGVPDDARSGTGRGRALIHMDGDDRTALDWTEAQTYFTACGLPADIADRVDRAHQQKLRETAGARQRPHLASHGGNTPREHTPPTCGNTPGTASREQPGTALPDAIPADKIARIRQLRGEGMTVRQVAADVGVAPRTVHKYTTVNQRQPALHVVKDD